MERLARLSDRSLDGLFAGQVPADDGDLADLAAFVRDLSEVFEERPAEETTAQHLAAIAAASRHLGESDALAATPPRGSTADRGRSPPLRLRRTMVKRHSLSSLPVRRAAGTALMLLLSAIGGAAYAGALPGPLQGRVSDLAKNVGVSLPGSAQTDAGTAEQSIIGRIDPATLGLSPLNSLGKVQQASVGQAQQVTAAQSTQSTTGQGADDNGNGAQNDVEDADPGNAAGGAQDDAEDADEAAAGASGQDDAEDVDQGAAGAGAEDDAEDADEGAAGAGAQDDPEDADEAIGGAGAQDDAEDADEGGAGEPVQSTVEDADEGSAEDADEGEGS
jgi:hypothetical protein